MHFVRSSANHLLLCPQGSTRQLAAHYFAGIQVYNLWEYWRWVDDGGTIDPNHVALAVEYAVILSFIRYHREMRSLESARSYVQMGAEIEAEGICALKGIHPQTARQIAKTAKMSLVHALEQSGSLHSEYHSGYSPTTTEFSSMHSSYQWA